MVDRLGRRRGMIIAVGGTAASSAATAATVGAASLIGVRSISGLGLAEQSVNATYLNELYELTEDQAIKKRRGFVYSMVQTGWPAGALLAAGFVAVVTSIFGEGAWRVAFLLATIPAVLVALLCRTLKESPQFEAQQTVRKLRRDGKHEESHGAGRRHRDRRADGGTVQADLPGKHLRNTVVLSLAWLFNWFGIQTFSVLGTTVLETGQGDRRVEHPAFWWCCRTWSVRWATSPTAGRVTVSAGATPSLSAGCCPVGSSRPCCLDRRTRSTCSSRT